MDNRPIGVFDSGLGGLTAFKALAKLLPHEDIVYFGDTGRVPYGTRSRETIVKYARQDMAFLQSRDVKMILAACGTVSSVAGAKGELLSDTLNVPFVGVLRPTAREAATATRNGKIGVLGTTATIRSGSYQKELAAINPELQVFGQDCPLFVPLVESGFVQPGDPITRLTVERYLAPMKEVGVDTLILGCTHYPIIAPVISEVMGDDVVLINSGREAARFSVALLAEMNLLTEKNGLGQRHFYVSDRTEGFSSVAGIFLGQDVQGEVSHIDIDRY